MFLGFSHYLLVSGTFYQAYDQSDLLGKIIFLSLIGTSICCWSILIHKIWVIKSVEKNSVAFRGVFHRQKGNPLQLENEQQFRKGNLNPFFDIFLVLKRHTIDILNKNHHFAEKEGKGSFLSSSDIDYIESHLVSTIASQTQHLEKNLFILSTIVGLAPLMGLLGTVWGILITFSNMQSNTLTTSNQMVLGGLALALTTTVLGILDAIPALIGYNYFKNYNRNFETEMENFSNEILSSVEMQYRKVD